MGASASRIPGQSRRLPRPTVVQSTPSREAPAAAAPHAAAAAAEHAPNDQGNQVRQPVAPEEGASPHAAVANSSDERVGDGTSITATAQGSADTDDKDVSLDVMLSKLGGSITGKRVDIMPKLQQAPQTSGQQSSGVLNGDLPGRIPTSHLTAMLGNYNKSNGTDFDVAGAAALWKVDPAVLRDVLHFNSLPLLMEPPPGAQDDTLSCEPRWRDSHKQRA